jgi:hypothetical protein
MSISHFLFVCDCIYCRGAARQGEGAAPWAKTPRAAAQSVAYLPAFR